MSPSEHQKFTRFAPFAVMGLLALLGGVFFSVLYTQQSQEIRSRANLTNGVQYVQGAMKTTDYKAASVTLPQSVTSGNLIVVAVSNLEGYISVKDSRNNTYKRAVTRASSSGQDEMSIWYAENVYGGSVTVTATSTASDWDTSVAVAAYEYAGILKSGALDKVASNDATSSSVTTGTTSSTSQANELVFAAGMFEDEVNRSITPGSGFTLRHAHGDSRNYYASIFTSDKIVTAAGPYGTSFSLNSSYSVEWNAAIVTFKADPNYASSYPTPTTSYTSTPETVTLTPVADSVVYQSSPTYNHGTKTVLEVETEYSHNQYSYLKFDLRPYAGRNLTGAKLRIRTASDYDAGSYDTVSVKTVADTAWTETGITYNNRPSISSTTLTSLYPKNYGSYYEGAISASTLQSALGGLLSIGMTNPGSDQVTFDSRETSYDPQLILTFAGVSYPTPTPTTYYAPTPTPTTYYAPTPTPTTYYAPTPTPTTPPTPTAGVYPPGVSVSPTSVYPGAQVTVTWGNVPNPSAKDWIGFVSSTTVLSENPWKYTSSCSQAFGTVAKASGSCTIGAPAEPGVYTVKILGDDSYVQIASGNTLTVTAPYQPTPTPTTYAAPTPTRTPTPSPTPIPVYATSTPMATPTISYGATSVNLTLALHGLGKGGDSANPNGTGNMTPKRPQRTVSVDVFDASNNLVKTVSGTVTFDSTSGQFKGLISLGSNVNTGSYIIRVKADQFLRTLVPGIQNLTQGQSFNTPPTAMVIGDINNDNTINILDFNVLMGCYSDLSPATDCPAGNKDKADLTDDGNVNQFDYNLFLRELTNRGGQ